MKKLGIFLGVLLIVSTLQSAVFGQVATTSVWPAQNRTSIKSSDAIKEADIIAGQNGVYNHLARTVAVSLLTTEGLTARDVTSTNADSSSMLGALSVGILPPFKMRIVNASSTPVIYRCKYAAATGTLTLATSSDGKITFDSDLAFENVFFSEPNWTLTPSANATLTIEIFTKGY